MEASGAEEITPTQIQVREVTDWQPTWTAGDPGAPGVFSIQLVLDRGAEEFVIRVTAEDAEVIQNLMRKSPTVWFDLERKVLMFGNRAVGD